MDKVKTMKKLFNKIGQALQVVLLAPVKLPAKLGDGLRYLAMVLGLLETLLEEEPEEPPPPGAAKETGLTPDSQAALQSVGQAAEPPPDDQVVPLSERLAAGPPLGQALQEAETAAESAVTDAAERSVADASE